MFNQFQAELYQRLQNYKLDDPSHEFGFTRHLMKNHGWTEKYAYRAIAEYKKFAFLTVVADHQIAPSDAVDQVWHAHILLTQSYWSDFCPNILRQKLHHHPARGGEAERAEFHHLYRQTIASYRHYFGNPPQDIWSPPEIRFGKELKMQRISTRDNWIIPKSLPKFKFNQIKFSLVLGLFIFLICLGKTAIASQSISIDNG
ncbi:MAG: TIGR04222 domain-containing membrane protein, partial [Cyanobacteria bacterium J06642_3]